MEFSTKNRENKDKIHSNFFATAFCAAFLLIVSLGAFGQSITITEITDVNAYEVLIGGTTTDYADGTLLTAYYGTTSVESSFSVGNSGEVYGGSFQINVTALQPGTNYYFQVRDDAGGITSNVYEYQTAATGGTSTGGNVSWVTIGSDDSFIGELPVNGEYNYSLSQQIYTNAEIDRTGAITKIALYNGNLQMTRTINLYMLSTYKQNFSDLDDWESVSSSDLVFSGEVTFLVSQWTEIELNTPFEYDGTGNIIVVVDDNTGNYESAMNFSAFEATGQSIYVSSDYTDYDATDLSAVSASSIGSVKNQIKFGFMDSSSQTSGDSVNWITIGAGNSTNQNLPVNSYYDYSLSQQIYTYAEIGHAGTIESVAFYNTSYETTRTIDLYMYNTDRQTFTSTNDWETVDPGDLVFSGEVTFLSDEWTEIPLNTPFEYDGLHNIIIVADDNTVIEATSLSFRVFSATSQAIYYSDYSTDIDPTYLNGTTALDVANVKSQIKFGFTATNPTFSYVDLGLTSGTKWATMNVGAERPEDFGTYFAWGETSTKTIYDWASYTYAAGESDAAPGFTKYCNDASLGNNGFTDELTVLQAGDDAATANLGSNWRMPTYDEILELTSECQYSYTTQNGVYGIIVTGPNNHTIFIPAAGGRQFENEVWEEGSGNYWASSLDTDNPTNAQGFYFASNGFGAISIMRRYGLPIRPVYVPSNTANNQNGNVIFQCDFEDDTENANWTLNTGGQTNHWEIGIPSMTNVEKSLYITNGNGNEYTNTSASYAYAYREVEITEAGNYQFEFDWMANGESNYDNLRAFFIPTTASPNLTDGESNGMTSSNNDAPTGWIDLYSQSGIMAGQSDWQHNTKSLSIDVTGTYYLVFFWKNDSGDGNNPPAAVDNIVVSREQQTNANTFTDTRDGKTYSYVTIGNQTWMAENLRYEGNIPLGSSTSTTEAYRYNPNDDADNVATYGYLYNWTAAMNGESSSASTPSGVQGICPEGWHLPSIDEWLELADALDGDTDKGSQLAGHSDLWTAQALTNSTYFGASGFDALPAGYYGGAYQGIGRNTYFWCATESALNNSSAFYQGISYDYTTLSNSGGQAYSGKDYAYSVRCVKDAVNTASYETGTFTDTRDGRSYDFVIIGEQTWMAENLRYDNSGSMTVAQGSEQSDTDPYLYYPNGDSQNLETYGYLYNWPAAMNGAESSDANPSGVQGICPLGWHLPSNAEWTQLVETLGDETNAGAMLAGNASIWTAGTLTASEYFGTSGFNVLPSGYYYPGDYGGFGSSTSFWSTTEDIESNTRVYLRDVDNSGTSLSRSRGSKTYGFSVRCIKDASNTANNNTNSDDIVYQSDFENTGEWSEWTLNNSGQTNYWTIGLGSSDVSTTETNCLYITNDGSSYNYNSGAESAVYAYKEIELSSTSNYHILFDWKCIGEESWDYLRAFIIPASENPNLSAGNVIGDGYEDANTTPDGWIDLYDGQMSSSDNQWRNAESTVALSAGNYYLVFYWRNDESAGSNPPAAVDNIFIYKLMPISVTTNVSDRTSTSVTLNGTITFAGEPENIAAGFKWGNSETSLLDNITTQSTGATFSEQLTGLTSQTTYYYQAYAVYDGDTAFSEITQFRTALDESSAGGANNPLPIGDMNDWQDFSNALQNPSTVTYKGVMLADYGQDIYFSLESDLSFTEAGVTFSIDNFKGNLNGNYNTITVQPYQTFTGLFANFSDGHIDNLNLRMNSSATLEGAGDFGVLCQNAYQAYISNCTVSGISSEELSSSDDGHFVGGLVGNASQTTISGCTNNLKITSDVARVGGIAGGASGTIMYCTNNAELRGAYVGGIVAENAATITNCLNTGLLNCSDEYAGGISALGGTIVCCMNIGEISATGTQRAGGIVGSAESTTTVTNCANYGVFPTFSSPMGGIAGNGSGTYSHNVSAPLCRSTEQAIYSLNEIYATVATEESEYNSASETDDFFDEQVGDIKVDSLRLRFAERGTPKTTAEIVGSQLSGSLSSEYWDFTEDLYPKPKYFTETSQTIAARIPIYLGPHQSVFGVWENFSLPTSIDGRQITWVSSDNAISISDGTATVTRPASGEDDIDVQITADYDGYTKTFVVRVIAPKQIPVYTGDASQDSVYIYLSGEFDNDTEGITYAYDYGFQYSTTSADLSEDVTSVQSDNLNHVFYDGRSFTYPLEDIPNGTMVYYRAYATTADGTEYGDILSYKALGAPVVVAHYPMWRTDNDATIELDITLNEGEYDEFYEMEKNVYFGTQRDNLATLGYIDYDAEYHEFSVNLHGLVPETKYYYVAEVTNDYGTTRSDTLEFLTYGTMTDSSDFTHYYTIQIGDQTWMAQNLKYAGDGVSLGTTTSETDPYYYYVNGDEANTDEYGYLYNWAAAMNGASSSTDNPSGVQGICPNGWHLPSNAEWTQLATTLGGTGNAGAMLSGQPAGEDQYWQSGTLTESGDFGKSGFNALPAGDYRSTYSGYGSYAYFWTATEQSSSIVYGRSIGITSTSLLSNSSPQKYFGYAVRCVKNLDIIVATNNATNVTTTSAILNGSISNASSSGITARGFMFGTESTNLTQDLQSTDNTTDFTYTLSDLTTNTTYYFKAYATINGETMYGDVKAFMTPSGVHDNYAYVDLGLPSGTMWATINLGAESFTEAGNRYAWGETTTKDEYTQSNYTYSDNPTILPAEADAAAVNWQGDWRMPTHEEMLELRNNCTATWIQDIEDGMLFTGPNGNSIFLHIYTDGNGTGYYWSSSIDADNSSKARGMSVYASTSFNNVGMTNASRYYGDYVRPVYRLVPTVATLSATDVSSTSAVLHGRISNIGNSEVTARGFKFGTSSDNLTETLTSTDNTDEFSYTLSDLEAGRTYYFRAFATNSDGTSYDEVKILMTPGGQQFAGHDYVDLGLPSGIMWATCNVGATSPEEGGNKYAWGETTTKDTYSQDSYTYSDNPEILPADHDAAVVVWGGGWHMPTSADFEELVNNCTLERTTLNDVEGYVFTGPNGNSIFMRNSYYWSSSLVITTQTNAYALSLNTTGANVRSNARTFGDYVRGVYSVPEVALSYPVWRDSLAVSLKAKYTINGTVQSYKYYTGTAKNSLSEVTEGVTISSDEHLLTVNVYNLSPRTEYWAMAEIVDEYGTYRSDTLSFYTYGSFVDSRNNTTYYTIQIGDQTWMAQNLKYAGDEVSLGTTTSETEHYYYYVNGNEANSDEYGYLYNWAAAMNGASASDENPSGVQGICPNGWHLPSDAEWTQLSDYLGGDDNAAAMLAGGDQYWLTDILTQSVNFGKSGFNALPTGYYARDYIEFSTYAAFWSATESENNKAYYRDFFNFSEIFGRHEAISDSHSYGFSYAVRCVKGTTIYAYDTVNYCGEQYTFGTQTLTANGDYEETFHLGTDKDSIVYLHLTMYPALTATINEFSNGCYGANNGYVEVTAGGGAGTYTYNWNTPEAQTTARVNNLGAGEYSVTVTDAARCTATVSQALTAPAELTASINGNNPNCFGDGTTLTADVNGGSPDYTYVWSNNETTESIVVTPTATTTYTITVTDANNCTATASKNVVVNSQLTVSISGDTQVQCFGDNTATLTASASGGSMATGYTYNWSNSLEGQTISTLGAGNYNVTVTDANGCFATASVTITQPSAALSVSISATNTTINCSNPSVTLTATPTGGTEDYTYSWSNSGTNNTSEVTAPGTYMVEVSDANSCTAEATQTITQDITVPTVTIDNTETELNCNRTSIALTATGNGASYVWSNGETNAATTVTNPGTYTVTATGSNGCTNEASTTITRVENPTVEVTAGEILCNGGTTTFTANVSNGKSPYSYRWQDNSTSQTLNAQAGTYSVTITDNNGCTASASTTVNVNDQTVPELTGTWPSNITGQNNCFANADISELLSNDAVEALYEDCSGITVSHTDVNTSTDNCGWTITRTYTIQDPYGNTVEPNPTMSVSGSDQTAPTLSGTWPANITGQNNCFADADISGLISDDDVADLYSDGCGGTITVNHSDENTLTDNCGWTITRTYTISDACGNETINTMSVSGSDQSAPTLTGTWPSNITGQNNCFANADLSGLISDDDVAALYGGCSGTVTVTHADVNTLTDNCGWTITRTYTINNACGTNSTTNTQSVSGSDQTVPTLTGTWPANITAQNNCFANADVSDLMSDDDVAELYSDGCGGTVSVTHTDANTTTDNCGWTITRTYTISDACGNEATNTQSVSGSDETAPTIGDDNLNRQLTSTNCTFIVPDLTSEVRNIASDNCTANGNLTIVQSITAGTEITTATTVIVTVTDQCGNNSTKEIELTLPEELTTSLSANPATIACNGGTTSITNTPSGGTTPYQYFWSNSTNEQSLASVLAGTYTVTVRDNNGCSVVESLEITQPAQLTVSLSAGTLNCHGETTYVTAETTGGTGDVSYLWSNAETTPSLLQMGGGTYSVTVTDANNCIATATITIDEPAELTSSLSTGTIGCNGGTANITNTVTGGTEPITYEWSNGSNTQGLTGVVAGEYTVTVRDNNGCSVVQSATISQPAALTVSLSTGAIACNGETTTISANVDGGTSPYTYAWNNDATTESITGAVAGTYSVTVTDANTCATSTAITITQPDALSVSISGPTSVCENTTTTLTANVQGGTTDYTYLWSYNNSTTVSITTPQLTTATEYSVTVTDANECSASASVNVEIGDTPGITIADVTAICVGGNAILQANVSNAGSDYEVVWSSSDTGAGLPDVLNTDAITVTPTTAGTYTYTVSLTATSCSDGQPFTSSEDVTLTVNALPDVAISNNTNETTITCSTTTISLTATGGTSYQWSNGGTTAENNITSAGNYIVTVTDANGCSNTESITIDEDVTAPAVSINNTTGTTLLTCTTTSINVEATGDDATYLWSNGETTATTAITTGGTYTVTATADNGCTSTAAIEITPNADAPSLSITNNTGETELTCALTSISVTATGSGTSYQWTGGASTNEASNTFTEPGTYTVVATAGNGCSASDQITITRNIEAPDIIASATASAICQGESTTISATGGQSYTWSPETGLPTTVGASITASPTSTITYTVTGVGANGCNGTADVTITVNLPTSSEFTAAACDLYTWNGTNYTESGDFQQTFPNANGCDSVVTLHLTINHAVTNEFSETACSSFEWNSTTYTESGDYVQTLQTVNGCDSVVTLHLTINTPTESNDTVTVCDSYEWNGTTYTETGNYQVTLPNANANGCDSIANLFLTINHAVTGIDRQEACESFTWIDGVTYTESTDSTAAPTFTLQNTEGCDSVVSLYLVVNHSTTNEVSAQMCSGVPYTYEGETFTEAGTYTVTLTNSHGCDSIVTLTITYANNCGGIVSGVVTDENTGDVISNARVTVGNQVTRTNAEGQFSLEVLRGRKALRVSAAGYISYGNMVDIQSDTVFNISLNAPHIETDVDSLTVSSYPYLEQSDSITLINTGSGTLVWSSITEYDNLALVEDSVIQQRRNTRSLWDSIQTFATRENAEQAIATDGFFIYTSSWMRPGEFNRYTPNGEYVETFYIENVGSIRNLSYDGTNFYGTEGTNIIFKLDLDNQTLVDSIETDIQEIRHCSFNKQDGSLLAGSWNSLYRIDVENGTSEQIRNDLANVYSSAIDNLSPGGPYLWLFSQTSQNNGPSAYIRQFNISTGEYTDRTHYLDDINLSSTSLAGGICASEYVCEGKFVLLANVQNPSGSNTIATYEIGRTNNVVRTGKKSGSIAPNSSENISVKASATETGDYSATIKYRAAVMGAYSRDIDVNISAVAPECDAVQQISIVTDTFHTVTLDWQPVELGNYESVSYLVFNTASQFAIDTVSGTTVTYDGLPVGNHCFCVMALSQAGYTCLSAASDTVCAEIEPIPCNVALTVEATNDGESIFLTWNKPVGVEYFRIHRDDNAIEEVLYDDSFVDTNVVPEVTYCYTVIAYFEGGICDEVVGTACTKIVSGVCAESPVLQIEAVGYSVHLNWTVTNDSYTYKIFRNDVAIGMTTDTTYFDNVNPGYNYCYKVESLCEYGMFTYSNEECVFVEVISEDENGQGSGDGDAIDEWTADNLTLYPNPTYGQFFIEGQRIAVVQIFNASGMLVAEIENTEDEHITINCDSWNPGLYNIRIISAEGETATRRVTIFR